MKYQSIVIEVIVYKPMDQIWEKLTLPEHVIKWNSASDDWYTPFAENDFRVGGTFLYKMAARDGSFGFDFGGVYEEIMTNRKIAYVLGDGRRVCMELTEEEGGIRITETFDAEETNSLELQKNGWQSILDHFKRYAEEEQTEEDQTEEDQTEEKQTEDENRDKMKQDKDTPNSNSIDDYIKNQKAEVQPVLQAIRETIHAAAPEAVEKISWSMPTFWQGENLIHFAVFKNHIGIFPGGEAVGVFADRLKEYKTSKGTIQLPFDRPVDYNLIEDIVCWRVKQSKERNKS